MANIPRSKNHVTYFYFKTLFLNVSTHFRKEYFLLSEMLRNKRGGLCLRAGFMARNRSDNKYILNIFFLSPILMSDSNLKKMLYVEAKAHLEKEITVKFTSIF